MEIITRPLNAWDKNSIRPGPVGSVGDVNTSVRLKQSAPDLTPRYSKQFSGKIGENSGSNVSDGMWYSYTSGGRVARTIREPFGYRRGFRTGVGWLVEDLRAPASREPKLGSIGNFGWQSQVASVKRAKVTGELFLPLPNGYSKESADGITRGSQIPTIIAESQGSGVALPAANVKVTDPIFGERGSIENPQMDLVPEYTVDPKVIWTPVVEDVRRQKSPAYNDHIRYVKFIDKSMWGTLTADWLDDSTNPQLVYDKSDDKKFMAVANHTGGIQRPANEKVPAVRRAIPGRVPKPVDTNPVPGKGTTTPVDSVPGSGIGGGSGTGLGLQCRSANMNGLFR